MDDRQAIKKFSASCTKEHEENFKKYRGEREGGKTDQKPLFDKDAQRGHLRKGAGADTMGREKNTLI